MKEDRPYSHHKGTIAVHPRRTLLGLPLAGLLLALAARADDPPKPAEPGTLVVVDGGGKEHTLKNGKFTLGTRRLAWLTVKEGTKEPAIEAREAKGAVKTAIPKAKDGPEALEFREEKSTTYVNGVLTLVPVDRLRALQIAHDK